RRSRQLWRPIYEQRGWRRSLQYAGGSYPSGHRSFGDPHSGSEINPVLHHAGSGILKEDIMTAKKIVVWTAGGIVALILLAVVAGFLLLKHSHRFRAYLLQRAEQSVNQSTGARVDVRDFRITFSGLQLDLDGIVVHGKESSSQPPLFMADHLGV